MKTIKIGLLLSALTLPLLSAKLFAAEENILLPITDMERITGTLSTTSFNPLLVQDQTGTQATIGKFVRFTPKPTSSTLLYFYLQPKYQTIALEEVKVIANFRGPTNNTQEWLFEIWNGKTWVELGFNRNVTANVWTTLSFKGLATNAYINSYKELMIRFGSKTNQSSARLDYIGVILNPKKDIAPIPTPTPSPTPSPTPTPIPPTDSWWKPTIGLKWTVQYAGTLIQKPEYVIYNLDMYDTAKSTIDELKAQGKRVICYFSGGSWEDWRTDASSFPSSVLGNGLDGWPGERWLDVRALDILRPIMQKRIEAAKAKGCDAVDSDNMDGYTNNSGFPLTYAHQLAYNRMIASIAHANGMGIGLKNDLDQIPDLVDYFDFAVNEQCYQYNECNTLAPFITRGKPVYNIEYNVSPSVFCPKSKVAKFDSIYKKLNLDGWVDPCWNY